MKSKTTAAILAFFLGGIGIHRFYLGQGGYGVLYLLFCWTLVPAVIALVDFVIFLSMDEAQFNEKYNKGHVVAYGSGVNTADELEKLHSLMSKGVISQEEFNQRKSKLL